MLLYNYGLYDPSSSLLFGLSCKKAPMYIDDTLYISYNTFMMNLHSEYLQHHRSSSFREDFSLYPMAVRYCNPQTNLYIIERPPFEIEVDFSTNRSYHARKSPKSLNSKTMWVPWTISVISWSNPQDFKFQMFFNNGPLNSLDDTVITSYLPNIDTRGWVCLGQDAIKVIQLITQNPQDITSIYNAAFNCYFSGWNSDLMPRFLLTPYIKRIIQDRISRLKHAPKALKYESTNFYGLNFTHSKYLTKVLFTVSNMPLEEILEYIQSCKDYYNSDNYKYDDRSLSKKIMSFGHLINNTSLSLPMNEMYLHTELLDLAKFTKPYKIDYTVLINQTKDSIIPSHLHINDYVDNPYIVSRIYDDIRTSYANLPMDPAFEHNHAIRNLNFQAPEIFQYCNVLQDVSIQNVS